LPAQTGGDAPILLSVVTGVTNLVAIAIMELARSRGP